MGFSLGMLGKPTGDKPGILEALKSATAYYIIILKLKRINFYALWAASIFKTIINVEK